MTSRDLRRPRARLIARLGLIAPIATLAVACSAPAPAAPATTPATATIPAAAATPAGSPPATATAAATAAATAGASASPGAPPSGTPAAATPPPKADAPASAPAATAAAPAAPRGSSVTVPIVNFAYGAAAGAAPLVVTWTNSDAVEHDVVFADGLTSPLLAPGASYTRRFEAAGAFTYMCSVHPFMTGEVAVR